MCQVYIAMHELQAVLFMLCKMAFQLSGMAITLHLDNSSAKAYFCTQGGTVHLFLSRLACYILNLTSRHGITLFPMYIPTPVNMEANYLSQRRLFTEWHLLH